MEKCSRRRTRAARRRPVNRPNYANIQARFSTRVAFLVLFHVGNKPPLRGWFRNTHFHSPTVERETLVALSVCHRKILLVLLAFPRHPVSLELLVYCFPSRVPTQSNNNHRTRGEADREEGSKGRWRVLSNTWSPREISTSFYIQPHIIHPCVVHSCCPFKNYIMNNSCTIRTLPT